MKFKSHLIIIRAFIRRLGVSEPPNPNTMFGYFYRRRALLCPNLYPVITLQTLTPSSSLLLLLLQPFSSSEEDRSFTVNYFINNCGLSPEIASKHSKLVHFNNSHKPDSVLAFFRGYGFSNSQLSALIRICPRLLTMDPNKTILPKLNFLLSKGASTSDLVHIVTKNPLFLYRSLERTITPSYHLVKRFMLSDESTIRSIKFCVGLIYSKRPAHNVQVLLQNRVPESKIAILFRNRFWLITEHPPIFKKAVQEVKELGFNPNTTVFLVALRAKVEGKLQWEKKIELYKKWGWSEEIIVSAFLRYPWCMLASLDNIEAMMQFFVNHMGWESQMLAKYPILLLMSLEKRVIPRAFVLQFLESRGLIKNAKSAAPFRVSEEVFLNKFVNCFQEEASQLLKLYEEKRDRP